MKKTNAMRLLDRAQITYRVESYDVDPSDLSAETVARKIRIEPERLLKTLVVRGSEGPVFAVVPTGSELDLKALARAAGDKKMALVPLRDVQSLTGYIRGGVTVLGAKRPFPVYLEAGTLELDEISVSAGARGLQILLSPADYATVTGARPATISTPKS